MKPANYTLTVHQGSTLDYTFQFSGLDLTGYSARMNAREYVDAVDPVITTEGVDANATISVDPGTSTIQISMTAEDTADLDFDSGQWDLEIYATVALVEYVYRLIGGAVILSKEVTR